MSCVPAALNPGDSHAVMSLLVCPVWKIKKNETSVQLMNYFKNRFVFMFRLLFPEQYISDYI